MSRFFYLFFFIVLFFLFVFYFFLTKKTDLISPVNLSRSEMCVIDSMIIVNYNGPKAQILWKNDTRSFYCEVREAFYDSLDKVKSKQIKAFYVQDFSDIDWGSYIDRWIVASEAYYVIDSNKDGAMGLTYVPFSKKGFAEKFLNFYGGKLVTFNEIDLNILFNSSSLLKNRLIN